MNILGLNCAYHEHSATILKDGALLAFVEEERFNSVRHGISASALSPRSLPWASIRFCLEKAELSLNEINCIAYSFLPYRRYQKTLEHTHPYAIDPLEFGASQTEELFLESHLKVPKMLQENGFKGRFFFLPHHLCHAASSFLHSPFEDAAVLVVDGIGETATSSLYRGSDTSLELIEQQDYPHSLGFLWEKLSYFLGFSIYDAAKVMGLAGYGDPKKHRKAFDSFVSIKDQLQIDDALIQFRSDDCSKLEELFKLEKRDTPISTIDSKLQSYADLAATLQEITEQSVLMLCKKAKNIHSTNLCYSGGVALNVLVNAKIREESGFANCYIPPVANDAGTSLGAALCAQNMIHKKKRIPFNPTPFLGSSVSLAEAEAILKKKKVEYKKPKAIEKEVAKLLAEGKIVARFAGRMEMGPRALGNRSLLADPRRIELKEKLNRTIKKREEFRPFCPSVLKEHASKWFEIDKEPSLPESYMLSTRKARAIAKEQAPAIVHTDGTARLQIVCKEIYPSYAKLIKEFFELTGVPLLLNTSFNAQEPIVCSFEDALHTVMSTEIDYLVTEDFIVQNPRVL